MPHYLKKNKRKHLIQSIKSELLMDEHIVFAYLFGSFKDYDDETGFGDIDIAIYYSPEDEDLLSESLLLAASLSSRYKLPFDCVPLNEAPLYFRYRVFLEGTELFCRDEELRDDLLEKTAVDALSFMPHREEAMRELV